MEKLVGAISQHGLSPWEVYVDETSNQKGSGVGLVLISPEKVIVEKYLRLDFSATNNEAEYEALMMGMVMVQSRGVHGSSSPDQPAGPVRNRPATTRTDQSDGRLRVATHRT